MYGTNGEVPRAVTDMFFPTRGCDMTALTSVLGVYVEGFRERGEYLSVRFGVLDMAHALLTAVTTRGPYFNESEVKAVEEAKGAEQVKAERAEEDRMISATIGGDKAAMASFLQMFKERKHMKGGCEKLEMKLLGRALNLVRVLSEPMGCMWEKDVQPLSFNWPLPPSPTSSSSPPALSPAPSIVVRLVRKSRGDTRRVVKCALSRYTLKTQDTEEKELMEVQQTHDFLKSPLGSSMMAGFGGGEP